MVQRLGEKGLSSLESKVNAERIKEVILALLAKRKPGASICPSEAARLLAQAEPEWRALMPQVLSVAKALMQNREVRITQGGVEITSAHDWKGPIRLALPEDQGQKREPKHPRPHGE